MFISYIAKMNLIYILIFLKKDISCTLLFLNSPNYLSIILKRDLSLLLKLIGIIIIFRSYNTKKNK